MNDQSNPTQTTVGAWDADLYDSKHAFVSEYGLELVEMLAPQPGERILDLGCGTGRLANEISKAGAQAVGVDIDPSMIERARAAYPDVEFVVADAARFTCDEPFDAVFSNAAIHWVKDTHGVMATLSEILKPGGRLVVELGGKGNIAAIIRAVDQALESVGHARPGQGLPWYFPSVADFTSRLEERGIVTGYAALFDRPTPLEDGPNGMRHWMSMFGAELLVHLPDELRERVVSEVESRLRPVMFHDGLWTADYRRLRVTAYKDQ